ncbi:sigma-54-dependent transcriptional regulator [Acidihalobacter ferrooxydans]|uniref:Sigma-54-dependent Fis family transcriptional regulator n=1 Tax=Acidihalobacter ferrooxydans TaxID=1765967 RepID=A0A1P8UFA6_9GAMM|nr:sigma-54 dependent transcriptional regulator [Acidihalobacter ferrooxydans]APZ42488.1 sigma-54-dependent Fis family transcriptional regulator [Acidihalobacter ferrooxydans]
MTDTLFIIEDEALLGQELLRHFKRENWDATLAGTLADAERELLASTPQPLVVLSDMSLPDGSALDLLERLREAGHRSEWIFLTGYGSVPDSVRALRLGAHEFLEKPCPRDRLDLVVAGAARAARAHRRLEREQQAGSQRYRPEAMLGDSPANRQVQELLRRLAQAPFTSLLLAGETGTGKGLAARILHHTGARSEGPFVHLNCAALPRELIEAELFGHEAGAFTGAHGRHAGLFEQADGGTLFLDEIGDLDTHLQAKLLTAIEERSIRRLGGAREIRVDAQIIAATHRDLAACVAQGSFRADLYHRMSVFRIQLPPLRERPQDLEQLVPAFVAEFSAIAGKELQRIPDDMMAELKRYNWPGNVRELRNVIERSVLLSEGPQLSTRWLQLCTTSPCPIAWPGGPMLELPLDGSLTLDDIERRVIEHTLDRHDGNLSAAARTLGVSRETLRYRVQKYALQK